MESAKADRIIQLALVRGHLSAAALEQARQNHARQDHAPPNDTQPSSGADRPHPDAAGLLDTLIRRGCLDESLVRRLAEELGGAPRTPPTGGPLTDPTPTAPAGDSGDPAFGARMAEWDRYRVVRLLGRGGMGEVFLAEDPRLGRRVAIKFLHRDDLETVERFLQEARIQARVQHEHVCRVYEVGDLEGRPFIAMQYIDGPPVAALRNELSWEEMVRIIIRAADALQAAHREGLVHRDVKPGNILVERRADGALHPYVVDFGLARELSASGLTVTGALLGTPAYMSPEQARGTREGVDRRADIYGLGATLYDLLTGVPPLAGPTAVATVVRILSEEPAPLRRRAPDLPPDLETVVMKCLEKDPARRYDSAFAVARDLEAVLAAEPILARPPSLRQRAVKLVRRHRTSAAVIAAVAAVTLVLGGWLAAEKWRLQAQARRAAEFGQEVSAIEQTLRVAYFAPAHDVTAEEREARAALVRLERQADAMADAAAGPGHYALGRGFLALRDWAAARRHLERAWTAGYRGGEVAGALGQALGALYLEEMDRVRRIRGKELREAQEAAIGRALREPALGYLTRAQGSAAGASDYVAATLALHESRWDEALVRARRAAAHTRWFFEAWVLQGRALQLRAGAASGRGDMAAARRDLDAAAAAFDEATAIARSAPTAFVERAVNAAQRLELEAVSGGDVPAAFAAGLTAWRQAAAVAPHDSRLHTQRAVLHWRLAEYQANSGEDPARALDEAVAAARDAVRADPANDDAQLNLGQAWWRRAESDQGRGVDARPALREAVVALTRAVELNPDSTGAENSLGLVYWTLADTEAAEGKDPRPNLERALQHLDGVIRINPRLATVHSNIGGVYSSIGTWEISHGLDPTVTHERGAAACRQAMAINPVLPHAWINLANIQLRQGSYLQQLNQDPRPLFREAIEAYQKAIGLNPRFAAGYTNLGTIYQRLAYQVLLEGGDPAALVSDAVAWYRRAQEVNPGSLTAFVNEGAAHTILARYVLESGRDPTAPLAAARAALTRGRAINPNSPSLHREWADAALVQARWNARPGGRPEAVFDEAERAAGEALRLNPDSADAALCRAQVRRHRAAWELVCRRRPDRWITGGIADATRTFEIDPEQFEALAVRAALRLLQAQVERNPEQAHLAASAAADDLHAALPKGPFLDRSLAPLLAEAERMAGGKQGVRR
ncbi:MAG TPA: protein kinase [Acidobacteriota bacterium]|mgnify:CR=1 FL=1|nr:protein kinase [Acidobacteriota bacterium]HQG93071.1 protein kinase [Acidobacteriota bacterium]